MRNIRSLPEIVRTTIRDRARYDELLVILQQGGATEENRLEFGALEAELHEFTRACQRSAALNPIALGFNWGDELIHEADPEFRATVREGAQVEINGEMMTLLDATKRLASTGKCAALGGWKGPAGLVRDLANLAPSVQPADLPQDDNHQSSPEDSADVPAATASPVPSVTPEAVRPSPAVGANYELFA